MRAEFTRGVSKREREREAERIVAPDETAKGEGVGRETKKKRKKKDGGGCFEP